MVHLVHQWWPATKRRGQNNLKVSIDCGYRLHFLVPGGHIGFLIGSPILRLKHHARRIHIRKSARGTKNEDFRDMNFFEIQHGSGSHIGFLRELFKPHL